MGKFLQLIVVIFTLSVLSIEVEGKRSKYRCAHCKPKGLYKEVFAYITHRGKSPDKEIVGNIFDVINTEQDLNYWNVGLERLLTHSQENV
ncbi:unnamed protein product, partial [Allacma fusca]